MNWLKTNKSLRHELLLYKKQHEQDRRYIRNLEDTIHKYGYTKVDHDFSDKRNEHGFPYGALVSKDV